VQCVELFIGRRVRREAVREQLNLKFSRLPPAFAESVMRQAAMIIISVSAWPMSAKNSGAMPSINLRSFSSLSLHIRIMSTQTERI
jgi:hypothetical protein